MTQAKIFLPILTYNHTCHTSFMFSLLKLVTLFKEAGLSATLYPITFDSLVNRARNAAVAHFLSDPSLTHLMFIDADIEFNPHDIIRLLQANEPIIGAPYAQKWLNLDKVKTVFNTTPLPAQPLSHCTNHSVHITPNQDTPDPSKSEVDYLTTGFMLIQRHVFETLIQHYPERNYKNDIDGYMSAHPEAFFNFFPIEINAITKRLESEDYAFCRLWKATGGKIYMLHDVHLTHYGFFGYGCTTNK